MATDTRPTALCTVREAAKVLSVSRSKVYQLMDSGSLPYVKFGKSRRLKFADVERLIEQNTIGAAHVAR